jgi:hypothetical protein
MIYDGASRELFEDQFFIIWQIKEILWILFGAKLISCSVLLSATF